MARQGRAVKRGAIQFAFHKHHRRHGQDWIWGEWKEYGSEETSWKSTWNNFLQILTQLSPHSAPSFYVTSFQEDFSDFGWLSSHLQSDPWYISPGHLSLPDIWELSTWRYSGTLWEQRPCLLHHIQCPHSSGKGQDYHGHHNFTEGGNNEHKYSRKVMMLPSKNNNSWQFQKCSGL